MLLFMELTSVCISWSAEATGVLDRAPPGHQVKRLCKGSKTSYSQRGEPQCHKGGKELRYMSPTFAVTFALFPSVSVSLPAESDFLFPCQWNSLKQGNDLLNIIAICIHTFFSVRRFCYHRRVTVLTARWWTCKYICVSSLILLTACRGCLNFFLFKSSLVWLWNITIYLNLRLRKGKLVDQWWPRKRWFSNSS